MAGGSSLRLRSNDSQLSIQVNPTTLSRGERFLIEGRELPLSASLVCAIVCWATHDPYGKVFMCCSPDVSSQTGSEPGTAPFFCFGRYLAGLDGGCQGNSIIEYTARLYALEAQMFRICKWGCRSPVRCHLISVVRPLPTG